MPDTQVSIAAQRNHHSVRQVILRSASPRAPSLISPKAEPWMKLKK